MILTFWTLRKSKNSTRLPPADKFAQKVMGEIIDGTDLLHPSFRFRLTPAQQIDFIKTNYLYADDLKRYYYIDKWAWLDGFLTAMCSIDVLGTYTWTDGVENRLQFFARADKEHCNSEAPQDFPLAGYKVHHGEVLTQLFDTNPVNGTYVLGIVNPEAGERGTVNYKIMTHQQLHKFVQKLMSTTNWLDINTQEISQSLSKMLFNPLQYVQDIFLIPVLPFRIDPDLTLKTGLKYGWWSFPDIQYYDNSKTLYTFEQLYTLPEHPQYAQDTTRAYLRRAPFTSRSLYVPGFPLVDCTPVYETNYSRDVNIKITLDITTGSCIMDLSTPVDTPPVMGTWRIDVPLSQITQNVTGVIGGVANMVGGAVGNLASLDLGGVADSIIGGAVSTLNAMSPTLSNVGSTDKSFAPFGIKGFIESIWKLQAVPDYSKIGYPAFKMAKIADIKAPSFVQTINAKFEPVNASFDEIEMLNNAYNAGVFLESRLP